MRALKRSCIGSASVAQLPHQVQPAVPTQPYHPPTVEEEEVSDVKSRRWT